MIWIGQSLAGIGAGALFPTSLAMIASGTHTATAKARGVAVWVSGFTFGAFIGPVIGGVAAAAHYGSDVYAGWRWAFLVVLVLAVVSAGFFFLAQDSSAPEGRSLDWPGQVTIAVAVFTLLFAVIQGPTTGWGSWQVIGCFVLAAVFLAAFVIAGLRSPAPLLQLSFFRHRSFAAVSAVTVIGMFAIPRHGLRARHPYYHDPGLLAAEELPCLGAAHRHDAACRPPPPGALQHQVGARRRARHHGDRRRVAGRGRD